eukprot:327738_1
MSFDPKRVKQLLNLIKSFEAKNKKPIISEDYITILEKGLEEDKLGFIEQNDNDREQLSKLQTTLCNYFHVNKHGQPLSVELFNRVQYYLITEHPLMHKQFMNNLPLLHNKFGRGGFVCMFANASEVKSMHFNETFRHIKANDIKTKLQNVGDGRFLWYPIHELFEPHPPIDSEAAYKRQHYDMNSSFLFIILTYIDWPKNMNYLLHESIVIYKQPSEKCKIQKYLKNVNKLKVHVFARKFPKFYNCLHPCPITDDGFNIRKYLNELKFENMYNSRKKIAAKTFVDMIKTKICSLFGTLIDDKDKCEIIQEINNAFGEELVQVLIDKSNEFFENISKIKKCFTYHDHAQTQLSVTAQLVCTMLLEMAKNDKLKMFIKQVMSCEKNIEYLMEQLNVDEMNQNEIQWECFVNKLIGRTCTNCNQRENRNINRIQWFGICRCKMHRYCSKKCQKIHWVNEHRFDCASYIVHV